MGEAWPGAHGVLLSPPPVLTLGGGTAFATCRATHVFLANPALAQ